VAASGRIVIVVLHDLTLAAAWADRLVFLHEGRVLATGAPEDVLTPKRLADVYGVQSAIARTEAGTRHLIVGGLASADDIRKAAGGAL
jgi:iron complex transport system ATP-binding protein